MKVLVAVSDGRLRDDYLTAVEGIRKRLLRHSQPNKLAFVGSYGSFKLAASEQKEMAFVGAGTSVRNEMVC